MKWVLVTQRSEYFVDRNETRDSLDRMWLEFLSACDLLPILCPNNIEIANYLIQHEKIAGLVLTGGESLIKYGGDNEIRDKVEHSLINNAIFKNIPIMGICRGFQTIADYFGNELEMVSNHVKVNHFFSICNKKIKVNSFHNWGLKNVNQDFSVILRSDDGVVEFFKHKFLNIYGIMWHPERENIFQEYDINLFHSVFYAD